MEKIQFNVRLEKDLLESIERYAEGERERLAYNVTKADIINRALREFFDRATSTGKK